MTFVGKILVLIITALALVFLGVSTVVFTTATNWKKATDDQKKIVQKLQGETNDLRNQLGGLEKDKQAAEATHKAALKQQEDRIAALQAEITQAQKDKEQAVTALEVAQQNAKTALEDSSARKQETDLLREQKAAVEKQANEFKLRQTELNDKIRELSRMLETATNNANDLRDRVARFQTLLRRNGLSDDITQVKGTETPPSVEGQVARVDDNRTVELTIGSDDGLVPGHELYLYRIKPRPEFLGKVKIISVDPDQSVARVIGATIQGKKIKEGDIVSSTIRPRS
jgi:multidrug efflux pump subunit AcrA (membrane-fusion protein)